MDYNESKTKDIIREGLVVYSQQLRLKKIGNPYAALAGDDEYHDYAALNKVSSETYDRLSEKGFIK